MKPIVDHEYLGTWSLEHDHRCAACHRPRALQAHHLVKRSRCRVDRGFNLLLLCLRCHYSAEGERVIDDQGERMPILTFAMCLGLKREADPAEWEPELLAEAYRSPLPEIEPLSDYYTRRRRRYGVRLEPLNGQDKAA